MRVIATTQDVAEGAAWLAQRDVRLAVALDQTGPLPLRLTGDGFAALLEKIVSQQVSVAAARAIWGRVEAAGLITPAAILEAGDEGLRAVGLSRPKIRYAAALARADIDFAALHRQSDAQVIDTLTAVPGVGIWTAQVYLMFGLGRADVFPPGDLALQESARLIFDLPSRPKPAELARLADDWSPWRAVAARLLFAYYRLAKDREGMT